jgi:glycosyltransferase involved in cell wall biosynthesis
MKILHLDHTVSPGGAEVALARLLRQAPPGQSTLLLPTSDTLGAFSHAGLDVAMRGPAQAPGANGLGAFGSLVRFTMGLLRMAYAVRTSEQFRLAQIVHANSSRSGLYGALACWGTSKVFVFHLRDRISSDSFGLVALTALRRLALRRADLVIGNSESTLETASSYIRWNAERVVIPSPSGVTRDAPPEPRADVATVGMVARLAPWKGQHILIEAFARAFPESRVRLVLAGGALFGEGAYRTELEQLAEQFGVADRVDFLGHVEDVQSVLNSLDIGIQASTRPEPLGQNILQYLASGLPTIATDAGGPTEWIDNGKNGLLVPMGSVSSLSQALIKLASSYDLRARLASAAWKTEGLLSDADVADAHWRIMRSVLNSRQRVHVEKSIQGRRYDR